MNPLEQRVQYLEGLLRALVKSDRYFFERSLQLADGRNIQTGRTTGTKVGLSALEKLGFYGATPVGQHSTTGQLSTTGGFGGVALADNGTFNGGLGGTAYTIGDMARALKNIGILAP